MVLPFSGATELNPTTCWGRLFQGNVYVNLVLLDLYYLVLTTDELL